MTETSKTTPGPWRVMQTGTRWAVTAEALFRGDVCRAQKRADAQLMSAAPDLLEALKAVVAVADRKTVEFDKAHAAIAKATGSETASSTPAGQRAAEQ